MNGDIQVTSIKHLTGLLILIIAISLSGCSSGVDNEIFPKYGLAEGDVIRVEITGTFGNTEWAEGQLYKKAALDTGTTMQLSLVGYDIEGVVSASLNAAWSSNNEEVAVVDREGTVTAVSAGDALVTVELRTDTDLVLTDAIDLTVLPSPVTGKQWIIKKTSLPQAIWDHASAIWNGNLYVAGGNSSCISNSGTGCGFSDKVYYAPIDKADGSIGTFSNASSLPAYLRGHSLLAYNGYLYVTGGIVQPTFSEPPYPDPLNFKTILNEKVYYALVNPDGSLGKWNIAALLPPPEDRDVPIPPDKTGLFALSASVHTALSSDGTKKGYIYVTGGWSGELNKNVNKVIIGPIDDSDGKIEPWIHNDLFNLPYDLSKHTSVVAAVNGNNYLYVIGGNSGSYGSQVFHHEVLYAKIAEDGILSQTETNGKLSTWHFASKSLPLQLIDHASVSTGRYIFVIGGRDGVEGNNDYVEEYHKSNNIISFYIEDSGDIQLLQRYIDLPEPLFHHAAAADTNETGTVNIYITGGAGGNTAEPENRKNSVYHFSAAQ